MANFQMASQGIYIIHSAFTARHLAAQIDMSAILSIADMAVFGFPLGCEFDSIQAYFNADDKNAFAPFIVIHLSSNPLIPFSVSLRLRPSPNSE